MSLDPRDQWAALCSAFRLIWSEADRYARKRMLLAVAIVVASSALAALAPIVYKFAIDSLAGREPLEGLLTPGWLIAAYLLSQYLLRTFGELRVLTQGEATQRLNRRLSRRTFEHVLSLPLGFHLDRKTGSIGETLTQGLTGCQLLMQHVVYTILPVTIEFAMIGVVLIQLGQSVYLVVLVLAAAAYALAFRYGARSITEPSQLAAAAHIEAHALLIDSLINCETVKYFDAEPRICSRYDQALNDIESAWNSFFRRKTLNGLIVAAIFAASLAASLGYSAHEVTHGAATVGDFVLINTYVIRLVQPLEIFGYAIRDMAQGVAFLEKMLALFAEQPESAGRAASSAADVRGELTFERVSFSYRPERGVLQSVSFSVAMGCTVAVVGESGSGKSSLVRLLFRLYEPDAGKILLDGVPISTMSLASVRGAIAVVPQDTVLFNDTIGNNIAFGKQGCSQEEIEKAARLAHLHEFVKGLPQGYDTPVGERGLKLSGGEKQRVAIARAALKQPRIFVFDEATSSLDSKTEQEILRNLSEVAKATTTLVIAHRLSTIVHADEIIVLDHGAVLERGSHETLLASNGRYAALWRMQESGRQQTEGLVLAGT